MRSERTEATTPGPGLNGHERAATEYPVREYVGAMAAELARMARMDGDERLGGLLDAAAAVASRDPGG